MPFQKGQSGNPKGYRKANPATLEARKHLQAAIDVLVGNLASEDEDTRHRAATALLDRGFGKPTEHVEVDAETKVEHKSDDLKQFTLEELRRLAGVV